MAIYYPSDASRLQLRKPVLTIGTFDGVHLGHRIILDEVKRHAAAIGGESMVITFEPHPRQVLQPEDSVPILTPLADKLALITEAGIQHVAVTPFTKEFSQLSADEYVEQFLVKKFHPECIVIGYDHHFGHDRAGNISMLKEYGPSRGFTVHEIPAHMVRDAAISSTRIRGSLLSGDMVSARQMLGRPYALRGVVVKGEQLGRKLGYPTANIQPLSRTQLIPAQGIYAVRVSVDGFKHGGMLSIGTRPTVSDSGMVSIEVYLFDFSRDIYGQEVVVHFIQRMRDELKFDSLDELIEALKQDEMDARGIIGELPN